MSEQAQLAAGDRPIEKMGHDRYLRTSRSRRSKAKIMGLTVALAVTLLVLLVISIYSTAKISSLGGEKLELELQLLASEKEVLALKPQLEKSRKELSELVAQRFPNLQPLTINKMLEINQGLIKQVVFTIIKQGNQQIYKYLVVADNSGKEKINPSFQLLLFDEFGVHVGSADVVDKRVLKVGESRDYTNEFELFFDSVPKHFYIEDLSAQYNIDDN